ncbi:putative NACHT domain-containing protein [Rosellinia necatrix]|uniref:Putative NACHT domain-containing protein n=1 Tax=Rosellinia necatrix TaxID=77044 RepID=A0A1W2TVR6_ROSNE|nr:putative NACHT domain-containing protein [Rosellinia necatrix]
MGLKPAISSVARRTMKSAFDDIESTITPDDSRGFSTVTLEDVKKAALDIENQLAARQALRNMRRLMPLFQGIEHYSHVVEILCNGTPYLSWIWAPITLILRIASEYVEAFEHVIKGYSRISESLGRFSTLNKAFSANMEFQQTLAVFYWDIMLFHKNAYQFVRRNSWKLLFLTSWGRFQRRFDNLLDDMKRHEALIDLQANASNIAEAREMREEIKVWKEDSLTHIQQLNEKETTKEYESIIAWFKADESDQLGILDIVSSESSKFSGTCSWALKNCKITSWLRPSPDQPILWLQGKPGSGKSVLTSEITKFMKASNQFVIRYFCSQRYTSSILYHEILRSILLQLLRNNDELITHVYKDYVLGRKPPTVQALEKLVLALLKATSSEPRQVKYVWIVLDGLNECEPRQQASVMSFLNQLTGKTASGGDTVCKILISSRHSPTIAKRLRVGQVMSLSDERKSVTMAIMQYVSQRLHSLHDKLRQLELSQKEIGDLTRVITNKADGMFLYARLVLDYLSREIFYSGAEIKSSIDELPKEISEFYQKILTQILVQLEQRSVDRLKSIFGWIAFSKRPLKRMEFLSALTFASGVSINKILVPSYVLDVCGPLVEERPDTTLTFIHVSVKEFLQSSTSNFQITQKEAATEHCVATITCLLSGFKYLLDEPPHAKAIRIVKGIHGLHVYATEFWTEHLLHYASLGDFNKSERLIKLANELADTLEKYTDSSPEDNLRLDDTSMDARLEFLKDQPLLSKHIEASLKARCLKRLEANILREAQGITANYSQNHSIALNSDALQNPKKSRYSPGRDGISTMLSSYQDITTFLLQQDHFSGVSSTELELWKSQFRTSAFTCRLGFCPRATEGFLSEDLRRQHEMAHTQLAICTIPDCKYPPFQTIRALKNHMNKCHLHKPARRPIRSGLLAVKDRENAKPRKLPESLDIEDIAAGGQRDKDVAIGKRKRDIEKDSLQQQLIDNQGVKASNQENSVDGIAIDESTFPKNESMGYRACAIQGCSERLDYDKTSETSKLHYWDWHHADSICRCADHRCQMLFANNECLEAHYIQRHTALFCTLCVDHDSEGYRLEGELLQHCMSTHIHKVKRWVCDDPNYQMRDCVLSSLMSAMPFDSCATCVSGQKYERKYDAIKHLLKVHFQSENDEPDSQVERFDPLYPFVVDVWVYEVETKMEPCKPEKSGMHTWYDSESDEEMELDEMFYVPELA